MNNRGQVAFILLFLTAIFLVVFSLYHFVIYGMNNDFKSGDLSEMSIEADFWKNYVAEESKFLAKESIKSGSGAKEEFIERASKIDSGDVAFDGAGNFFFKIRNGEFKFEKVSSDNGAAERYLLEIDGLFVYTERGANSVKRSFDIKMEFDDKGTFINNN